MKDIFNGLYKKVLGFFQSDQTGKGEEGENSKVTATNRLKLVLLHDRTNLDTITMQKMREQLIDVISRYIEIDQEALDLNLEGEGESIALMLNIPVIKARTKEEIEELEQQAHEAQIAEIKALLDEEKSQEEEKSIEEQEENTEDSDENKESEQPSDENDEQSEPPNDEESGESQEETEESEETPPQNNEDESKPEEQAESQGGETKKNKKSKKN